MKRKIALAMVLAMTATMAQPVLAADDKTTLDVIISQYGTQLLDEADRKSTRLNSSHKHRSRMPSSA